MKLRPTELVTLYDSKSKLFPLREDVLAPVRKSSNGKLCVEYQQAAFILYRLPSDQLAIFEDEIQHGLDLNYLTEEISLETVPGIIDMSSQKIEECTTLNLESNQFGVYFYVTCSDTLLLHLVEYAETKCAATLHSWDDSGFYHNERSFSARLKFSPYTNANAIMAQLSDFINRLNEQRLLNEVARMSELQGKSTTATQSKRQKMAASTASPHTIEPQPIEVPVKDVTHEQTRIPESVKKKQVTAMEKTLRSALFFGFPNLAIHPESLYALVERYSDQHAIFRVLKKLSDNHDVATKTLHGRAQKTGWREVAQHISTGRDSRGRVYLRPAHNKSSTDMHTWDILITWKKDKKAQDQTIAKLSNLSPFENSKAILN